MTLKYVLLLLATFLFSCDGMNNIKGHNSLRVYLIRHAERPESGDNLNCQGMNRSLLLADVLYSKFQLADYIFVPALEEGRITKVARMLETVTPYASKYNVAIDSRFDVKDEKGVAEAILEKSGVVLVVWQHNSLKDIVKALGVKGKFEWVDPDYDTIWIVTFNDGKATLTTDKQNINPSTACDF